MQLDGLNLVAARHTFADGQPSDADVAAWQREGVQVVLSNGDGAVIAGPVGAPALRELLGG